ncbi:Tryptophan-associated transmembrane protein [Actinomadura rubteroloni]|uniref:Tryptophan-associated transmembrane protein n=1 Tax=Actinomadura rubteroloni TaxID=1926885 RepID=A0A2P4UFY0_9ACTN|nr:Trp biosynthesis-associated membrane protein [Actinomadura rubteroloni]POM23952.1 Tryptophan-associated transmembrane protein [Actinomadura rubteroloni]
MSGREGSAARERGLAALLCAAGAGLTLLAAGRPWATVRARDAITPFAGHLTGGDLGWAGALGWAGLAGVAALFAVPGRGRSVVGALLAVFGGLMVYASVTAVGHAHVIAVAGEKSALLRLGARPEVTTSLWWLASAAGGVLLATGGLVVLVRGARWPGMSARYERAGRAAARPAEPDDAAALWKSLDRGEDPTADDAERPAGRRR